MDEASFEDGTIRRAAPVDGPLASGAAGAARASGSDAATGPDDDLDDDLDRGPRPEVDPIRALLFDAALRSLDRAQRALASPGSAVGAMGLSEIVRARRTLDELRTRAQVQWLGDGADGTAETLVSLYEFCSDRLAHAARIRDPELIPAVVEVLTELRDAFAG